jgi:hypothetical protein
VLPDKVDEGLEELEQVFALANTAADHDTLPRPSAKRRGDDGLDVVTAVEPEQAVLDVDALLDEPRRRLPDRRRRTYVARCLPVSVEPSATRSAGVPSKTTRPPS